MNRCDELDRTMPIYRKGLNGPITCTSNIPKNVTPSGYKKSLSSLFAYPRKNNKQVKGK